jgi:hypothetical protein
MDHEKANRPERAGETSESSWRTLPPTRKQLEMLRGLLGWPNHRADGMNRGQVSDMIERLRGR